MSPPKAGGTPIQEQLQAWKTSTGQLAPISQGSSSSQLAQSPVEMDVDQTETGVLPGDEGLALGPDGQFVGQIGGQASTAIGVDLERSSSEGN